MEIQLYSTALVLCYNYRHMLFSICADRDPTFALNGNEYHRINETHKSHDPLQYPLMFPHGTDGYHINILFTSKRTMC